jgi:hypothetical protein
MKTQELRDLIAAQTKCITCEELQEAGVIAHQSILESVSDIERESFHYLIALKTRVFDKVLHRIIWGEPKPSNAYQIDEGEAADNQYEFRKDSEMEECA